MKNPEKLAALKEGFYKRFTYEAGDGYRMTTNANKTPADIWNFFMLHLNDGIGLTEIIEPKKR